MPMVSPPRNGPATVEVFKTEEKGSDVNLATFLLLDGFDSLYDETVIISDDSDLAEPMAQANHRFDPVHIVSPRALRLNALIDGAATWAPLSLATLASCQLPSPLLLPTGNTIYRPPEST
jgi:hypothetical protein